MMKYYLVEEKFLVRCPDGDVDYIWEDGQWKNEFDCNDEDFATRYEDYRQNSDLYSNPKFIRLISEDEAQALYPVAFIDSVVAAEAQQLMQYVARYISGPAVEFKTHCRFDNVVRYIDVKSVSTVARQLAKQQQFSQFTVTLPGLAYRRGQ